MSDRFAELVLLVSELAEEDPTFGSTKLNKLLYLIDVSRYRDTGETVSGQSYQRLTHGPCPRGLLPVRKKLIDDGSLDLVDGVLGGFSQQRPKALRPADRSIFTDVETRLIETVIKTEWQVTASELSERTPRMPGWQTVDDQETIAMETCLVENVVESPIPERVLSWAASLPDPFAAVR